MKKNLFIGLTATTFAVVAIFACKRGMDSFDARGAFAGPNIVDTCTPVSCIQNVCSITRSGTDTLRGVITGERVLDNTKTIILDGKAYVDSGASLIIPAGTLIKAIKKSTNDSASALIVTRGGYIEANGTSTCPVVFTSNQASPASGDWGGIVLLGKAPINKPDTSIEGIQLPSVPAGVNVKYGGGGAGQGDPNDNSGVLTYVRIEYAGAVIATDNELNGLTCGGVGDGTILSYIQVYKGNDDAFEFFGGTVNADHLYAYVPDDDAFDFDFGYVGHIQFAVSVLNNTDDYSANPNGVECDNDGQGTGATPQTRPVLSNLTVIGVCDSVDSKRTNDVLLQGAHFRRASIYVLRNSILMGFPAGVLLDGSVSDAGKAELKNNIIHGFDVPLKTTVGGGTFTLATGLTFRTRGANDSIQLVAPCNSCPDFRPKVGSYPTTLGTNFGSWTVSTDGDYFTSVSYVGAFAGCNVANANWLQGWTKN